MSAIEKGVIILVLCIFDIIFTLYHVDVGATEINPIAKFLLEQSYTFFVIAKLFWTTGLIVFLLICCTTDLRFKIVKLGMDLLILVYVAVNLYHMYLFLQPTWSTYSPI
jgi:hypothetical protein